MKEHCETGLNALDIFAGAGGLALGIAQAGINNSVVIDLNHLACETLRENKRLRIKHVVDWKILESDLRDFDFNQYADRIDLLSGGPPCQPFSVGGKGQGRDDGRDMFPHAVRAVREIRPKAFIFENVTGILRHHLNGYFQYIIYQLMFPGLQRRHGEKWKEHRARLERLYTGGGNVGLRYNVISQKLSATDFGIPQRRERVFIVGVLESCNIEYAFPLVTHSRAALLQDQWLTGEYWLKHGFSKRRSLKVPEEVKGALSSLKRQSISTEPWRTVRDAISDLPRVAVGKTSTTIPNHFLNGGAREYDGHTGSPLDLPAKTIKAGFHGVPGGENMVRLDDGTVRYFSVRECARLQTFPDKWRFNGAWTRCMQQLGNAVPVELSRIVAQPLIDALSRSKAATLP